METPVDPRKGVRISPEAFAVLDQLVKSTGMKQYVVVERFLSWLGTQPDEVKQQFVIPGGDPAGKLIELRDRQRAETGEVPPVGFAEAIKQIRSLTEQLDAMERAYRPIIEKAVADKVAKSKSPKG